METPDLADDGDDESDVEQSDDVDEAQVQGGDLVETDDDSPAEDVDEATVDLDGDDLMGGGGDIFDGVEGAERNGGGESDSSSDDGDEGDDGGAADEAGFGGIADGLEGNAAELEEAINEGAARLGVVGLTDDDFEDSDLTRDDLETELRETFQAFRLGYFGSRSVETYVLEPADGDVSPAWGLAGSMLMAAAMCVWLRPDGDEAIDRVREAISGIGGTA